MSRMKTLEEVQETLDRIYGKDVWTIIAYEGNEKPCKLKHKCGELKVLTLGKNIRNGKLLCSCDPTPKALQEVYKRNTVKKEDFQKSIDNVYGEGVWTIVEFEGSSKPLKLEHNCGKLKRISRALNVKKGFLTCECELKKNQ